MPRKSVVSSPASAPQWRTRQYAELNRPVVDLVGDKTAKALTPLRIRTIGDLLNHLPRRFMTGGENSDFSELVVGDDVAIVAEVANQGQIRGQEPRCRLETVLTDGTRFLRTTFFGRQRYLQAWQTQLTAGARAIFVGKVGEFNNELQLSHPQFVVIDEHGRVIDARSRMAEQHEAIAELVGRGGLLALYPATSKFVTWQVASTVELALDHMGHFDDPLPEWVRTSRNLMGEHEAYHGVHRPTNRLDADAALHRLRHDEAIALQLAMARRRHAARGEQAPKLAAVADGLLDRFDERLAFELTRGQVEVTEQIFTDMARPHPMQRLLQGEVGSGKTLVALRAMLRAVDAGHQAALVAPTEVLAQQHAASITRMLGDLADGRTLGAPEVATEVVLLTGSMGSAATRAAQLRIASGEAGLVVGTHALFSKAVQFADLALVVVDEQHRFGVEQRAALGRRPDGLRPHQLVMTATPIPRSIAMTAFGDLETSVLTEVPAGRSEVQTTVVDLARHGSWVERAWQRIREEVEAGRQAFVVCPRIDADDPADEVTDAAGAVDAEGGAQRSMASVVETHDMLAAGPLQGLRLGLLHGRLAPDEKDRTMAAFAAGELDVLVSTTVVEVGVDVPNASVMVVLDADRFGVSQLHQLRGRIGRGEHPGLCLLLTASPWDSPAMERLQALARTRDGFELAELDLAQRREGNVLGAAQSGGRSSLKLLRVLDNADIIADARTIAEQLVLDDPDADDDLLADMVTQVESLSAGEWLERS